MTQQSFHHIAPGELQSPHEINRTAKDAESAKLETPRNWPISSFRWRSWRFKKEDFAIVLPHRLLRIDSVRKATYYVGLQDA